MPEGTNVQLSPTGTTVFTYQGGSLNFSSPPRYLGNIAHPPAEAHWRTDAGTVDPNATRPSGLIYSGGDTDEPDFFSASSPYRPLSFLRQGQDLETDKCRSLWLVAGILAFLLITDV